MRYMTVLLIMIHLSCSAGSFEGTDKPSSPISEIKKVGFSANFISSEKRFLSYAKVNGRTSIINPETGAEVWSTIAGGFLGGVPLPDYQGASLFSADELRIIYSHSSRSFNLTEYSEGVGIAGSQVAYTLPAEDGKSFRVIRYMGENGWQDESFTVPWSSSLSSYSTNPTGESSLLVTAINDDGTVVIAFHPADGSYAFYKAASWEQNLTEPDSHCSGDGVGTPENATFRSISWHGELETFFLGDRSGNIYAIGTLEGCPSIASLPQIPLNNSYPVLQLSPGPEKKLLVSQESELTILTYENSSFTIVERVENLCNLPIEAHLSNNNFLTLLCVESESSYSEGSTPAEFPILPQRTIETYSLDSSTKVSSFSYTPSTIAGMSIDPDLNRIYVMRNSSMGVFDTWNLVNGGLMRKTGTSIIGILD